MPQLPPFLNQYESIPNLTSPMRLTPRMMPYDPDNDSESSSDWETTPLTPMGPTMSGLSSNPSTERFLAMPVPLLGTSEGATSRSDLPITSLGPENPWVSSSPSTEENDSTNQGLQPLKSNSLPTKTEAYEPQMRAANFRGYDPTPEKNREHWSSASPIWWTEQDLLVVLSMNDTTFRYDDKTFS